MMVAVVATTRSLPRIVAVNCVLFTNVVARMLLFHRTVAPLTKSVPVTVSVKVEPPTAAVLCDRLTSAGIGLPPVHVETHPVMRPFSTIKFEGELATQIETLEARWLTLSEEIDWIR